MVMVEQHLRHHLRQILYFWILWLHHQWHKLSWLCRHLLRRTVLKYSEYQRLFLSNSNSNHHHLRLFHHLRQIPTLLFRHSNSNSCRFSNNNKIRGGCQPSQRLYHRRNNLHQIIGTAWPPTVEDLHNRRLQHQHHLIHLVGQILLRTILPHRSDRHPHLRLLVHHRKNIHLLHRHRA